MTGFALIRYWPLRWFPGGHSVSVLEWPVATKLFRRTISGTRAQQILHLTSKDIMFASKLLLSVALLGVASSRVHSGAKIQSRVVAYSRLVCQISRVACSIACSVHSVGTLSQDMGKSMAIPYGWRIIAVCYGLC